MVQLVVLQFKLQVTQALRYVRDALSKAGYTPIVTGDPEEALRLVEEEKPHLALLDLMLPETDGIELMRDILEMADVPVIFLSAYGRDEHGKGTDLHGLGESDRLLDMLTPSYPLSRTSVFDACYTKIISWTCFCLASQGAG